MQPSRPSEQTPANAGSTTPEPASQAPAELAHELDRLRAAGEENRAFIRATQRELRKPLNSLVGVLRDLQAQTSDRTTWDAMRTALNWTMSLSRLIGDLLELAVVQADDGDVGAIEFDLRDLVDEITHTTLPSLAPFTQIHSDVRPEVPSMLMAQPNRIRQILIAATQHLFATRRAQAMDIRVERLSETRTHVSLQVMLRNPDPDLPALQDEAMAAAIRDNFALLVAQRLTQGFRGGLDLTDGGDTIRVRMTLKKPEVLSATAVTPISAARPAPPAPAPAPAPAPEARMSETAAPEPKANASESESAPEAEAAPAPKAAPEPEAAPQPEPVAEAPAPAAASQPPAAPAKPSDTQEAPARAPATPPAAPAPPVAKPAPPAAAPAPPATDAPQGADIPEFSLQGTRVLLVGSTGPSSVALRIAMRALGCESSSAEEIDPAFDQLVDAGRRMKPFHICVVDFSGADGDAEAFAARVRGIDELRDLQLVLLVEIGSSGDAEWAEQAGYSAYLTKPVSGEELEPIFKELLQRTASADPGPLVTRHSVRETRRQRLTCLVVDDDRVNLLALKTMIERLGHAVDTAICGTEALEKAMVHRYDLLLSDVRMPDMDGDDLAARILAAQSSERRRPTPIFAMSANSLPGDAVRCRASGMRNYFLKPLTLPLLTQLLRYAMEDAAKGAETANPPDDPAGDATEPAVNAVPEPAPVPEQMPEEAGPMAIGEKTPIDLDHLEMASVGVPELRREMLATFRREMADGMEHLGELIRSGNDGATAMLASALNSTCASIGALDCGRHLSEIERRAAGGELDTLGPLFAESLAEWDRVQAFLATLDDEANAA